jgi:copper transport protein
MTKWLSIIGVLAFSMNAHAHSELAASTPADDANLETAPQEIELRFSEAVTLTMLSIARADQDKRALGPLPAKAATAFKIPVTGLTDGHYSVTWRALSGDTHVMSGDLTFSIGAEAAATHHSTEHAEHAEHGGDHAQQ